MNTTKNGSVTFLIFKEKGARYYTGVCLDFGIVIQDKNEGIVKCELEKATKGYLKTIAKNGMDEKLLNRQAEKKYYDIYSSILVAQQKRLTSNSTATNLIDKYREVNWNLMPVSNLMQACA